MFNVALAGGLIYPLTPKPTLYFFELFVVFVFDGNVILKYERFSFVVLLYVLYGELLSIATLVTEDMPGVVIIVELIVFPDGTGLAIACT